MKSVMQISSPRSTVFACLSDVARWIEWYPGCEKSSVLAAADSTINAEITLNSMKRVTFTEAFDLEQNQLISFKMVSSKDLRDYSGSYRLMDASTGAGTVVMAEVELDAAGGAPRFLVDRMLKNMLSDLAKALEKRAASLPAAAPATAKPAAAANAARPKKAKRAKCLLRIVRTAEGDKVWYLGKTLSAG